MANQDKPLKVGQILYCDSISDGAGPVEHQIKFYQIDHITPSGKTFLLRKLETLPVKEGFIPGNPAAHSFSRRVNILKDGTHCIRISYFDYIFFSHNCLYDGATVTTRE